MYIYNVTVNIEESVHADWLDWMKNTHIPQVLATGCFTENLILRLLIEEEQEGTTTYAVQYTFTDMEHYNTYCDTFAPALQADAKNRYQDKFVAFRTLLQHV